MLLIEEVGMSRPEIMTIGKLAQSAGIGVETVRFYERKGLLEEPSRGESGYRQYPPGTLSRLRFIRQAKELGFTLPEIQELLSLRVSPAASCAEVQERIQAKVEGIRGKICSLERMERALNDMAALCSSEALPASECPILDALEQETE
jgi:Hg(II)-responsive transcriptional regulator